MFSALLPRKNVVKFKCELVCSVAFFHVGNFLVSAFCERKLTQRRGRRAYCILMG